MTLLATSDMGWPSAVATVAFLAAACFVAWLWFRSDDI